MEFKSIEWHKANAARSEAWLAEMCKKLGITVEDLRQLSLPKH
jgi:hypothetical protein